MTINPDWTREDLAEIIIVQKSTIDTQGQVIKAKQESIDHLSKIYDIQREMVAVMRDRIQIQEETITGLAKDLLIRSRWVRKGIAKIFLEDRAANES